MKEGDICHHCLLIWLCDTYVCDVGRRRDVGAEVRGSGVGIKGESEGEHREVWTVGKGGGEGDKRKREKEGKGVRRKEERGKEEGGKEGGREEGCKERGKQSPLH